MPAKNGRAKNLAHQSFRHTIAQDGRFQAALKQRLGSRPTLPFLTQRGLGIFPLKRKAAPHHLAELALGFLLTALLARTLESRAGSVHSQDWEFYAATACLYLVFAFPAFVWRYFWHGRNKE